MKKFTLEDIPARRKYNLSELVKKHGSVISIGRDEKNIICLSEKK